MVSERAIPHCLRAVCIDGGEPAAVHQAWVRHPGRSQNDVISKDFQAGWKAGRDHQAALSAAQRQPETGEAERLRGALELVAEDLHSQHRLEDRRLGGPTIEEWQDCTVGACVTAQEALAQPARDGGAGDEPCQHESWETIKGSDTMVRCADCREAFDWSPDAPRETPLEHTDFVPGPLEGCNFQAPGAIRCGWPERLHGAARPAASDGGE